MQLSSSNSMTLLRIEQFLKDKHNTNPNSIASLSLTRKALSDVSCFTQFTNLERLDLAFNSLTSLQGLSSCLNLKWLSVVQNKFQSLEGIERLSMLTVLNGGKNKLKSMDEIRFLVSLRALILNDNEIVSTVKELNTLVLSRNPIHEIGESIVKVKSITQLSLKLPLQTIGSSLKSCTELKELRLAHNDIKVLKLLPDWHIFNARPIDKGSRRADIGKVVDFSQLPDNNKLEVPKERQGIL